MEDQKMLGTPSSKWSHINLYPYLPVSFLYVFFFFLPGREDHSLSFFPDQLSLQNPFLCSLTVLVQSQVPTFLPFDLSLFEWLSQCNNPVGSLLRFTHGAVRILFSFLSELSFLSLWLCFLGLVYFMVLGLPSHL